MKSWKVSERILGGLRGGVAMLDLLIRHSNICRSRILHLCDSRVALFAMAKAGSPSWGLPSVLRRKAGFCLFGRLPPLPVGLLQTRCLWIGFRVIDV